MFVRNTCYYLKYILDLGGVDPQSLLLPIDFDFRRKVVQNDHCYTNLMFLGDKKKSTNPTAATASAKKTSSSKAVTNQSNKSSSKNNTTKERIQSDSEGESGNDEEKQDDEEEEEEISYSESDDEDDMDFNVNYRFGKKGKRKRKYRKHKQKASTFKDFLETGEIALPEDEAKRKYGKKQKLKSTTISPKTSGNLTKLSQESSSNTIKSIRPLIKKTPVQSSSSKDLSTLSFSILEKNELDANFGMPKVIKQEQVEKSIQLPAKIAQSKEKEIVDSIAKDLETSFPVKIENNSKDTTTKPNISLSDKIPTANSLDLNALKELDSTDEEIGDAIIAVLGENVLDELLNQSDLISFDANNQSASTPSHQNPTEVSSSPVILNDSSSAPVTPEKAGEQLSKLDTIKVVRNGRVIILPPIEKPATRGSKRKSVSESPTTASPPITPSTVQTTLKLIKIEKPPSVKESSDSRNSSRRSSLNKSESGRSRLSTGGADDETDDLVSDASCASEDDPERLWCICKQPHNNRFMICCDKCEEWYHGKCVNVSKAMGKVIEQENKKWYCPTCKNGGSPMQGDKKPMNQLKLTKFFMKNSSKSNQSSVMCVVCKKKPTRESSIYCSDECIQNHALQHSDEKKDDVKDKIQNKSFEKEHHNFVKNKAADNKNVHELFSNPVKIQTNSNNVKTTPDTKSAIVIKSNNPTKVITPLHRQSSSSHLTKSNEKSETKPTYSKTSNEKSRIEQERKNIKSILASTLKTRMEGFNHPEIPKMTNEEIDEFAGKVEHEMFLYFNKDTRDKYKTKYRSLKFNLGDVKNKTLLEKICSKKIEPKQLVSLTSADLASEDLAKWREHENKHQLEIITKSELDALAQTKVVLKSHKGEEVIESKSETNDIAIQDVELVISKTVLKMEDNELNVSSANNTSSVDHDKHRSRHRSRSRDRHHHKSSSSSHSKHRRSRSRSRNHKNSSKSSSSHDKSKRSSDHKHKRSRSKSRNRSKSRDKSKKDDHHNKSSEKHDKHHHHHHHHSKSTEKVETKITEIIPEKQDVDLVGKILDSMGVHVNLEIKKPSRDEESKIEISTIREEPPLVEPIIEPKEEIQLFSGHLTVPDVNSFDIVAMKISGNLEEMNDNFNHQLDMIGRIEPKLVWDYIEKVMKSPGKEVCILRFATDDLEAHQGAFQHLQSRQRFGVIKLQSPTIIKDFYIIPLEKKDSLPSMLHPLTRSTLIEDENREDLLIGIAIKVLQDNRVSFSIEYILKLNFNTLYHFR